MSKLDYDFMKRLLETPSPTGFEEPAAEVIRERLSDVADDIRTDTMGSVHAKVCAHGRLCTTTGASAALSHESSDAASAPTLSKHARARNFLRRPRTPKIMLSTHMDEIGLMVTYISPEGFLSVAAIGGVDAAILPGMRVDVHSSAKITLRGVVGRKPIHLIEPDERKNVTPLAGLVIDLGLPPKKVKKLVKVGDAITFGVGFERFGKKMAVSRAFDDKIGVYIACEVAKNLAAAKRLDSNFIAAITVQEEIGTRGAITSAHSIRPDVAVAFDVTHATDYPGIDKTKYGNIVCGDGPVIARGPNINPAVFERLVAAARAEGIKYQIEAEPGVTGTDARSIQIARGGIPTGLVSVPLRYMHTPTEVISLKDVQGAIRLLTRFVTDITPDASFVPGMYDTPSLDFGEGGEGDCRREKRARGKHGGKKRNADKRNEDAPSGDAPVPSGDAPVTSGDAPDPNGDVYFARSANYTSPAAGAGAPADATSPSPSHVNSADNDVEFPG